MVDLLSIKYYHNLIYIKQLLTCFKLSFSCNSMSVNISDRRNYLIGISWFVASLAICIFNDSIMKFFGSEYSTFEIVFLRYLFATVSLVPFILKSRAHFRTKSILIHIVRGMLLFSGIALYCYGLSGIPFSTAVTINFTIPIFTIILATIFLKERATKAQIIATIIGFIGIYIIVEPANAGFRTHIALLMLASSFIFATLDVINKKLVSRESILSMLFYTAIAAVLFATYPAIKHWHPVKYQHLIFFAILGVGANVLLFCILKAFARIDVSAVAPFRYVEFLLSALVGFMFFKEIHSIATLCGSAVIIPSTLYVIKSEIKKNSKAMKIE